MVISVAVWSIAVRPGERESVIPQGDLRITNVALGDELSDKSGRTTVKFTYLRPVNVEDSDEDDEETGIEGAEATTVLCSLIPGTIEQATVDVTLEADEEFLFEVVGKNTVYLTGNYIDQSLDNVPFNDDSEMEDEDEFDLRDVSSDVELNPDELDIPSDDDADRFEEVHDEAEAPKSLKRPRASDVIETAEPAEGKLSKTQQKKANKKLKAESGAAVPSGSNTKADATTSEDAKKDKKEKEKKEKKEKEKVVGKGVEKDVEKPANEGASAMKELPGGLKVKDVKTGTGPQAKKGQTVHMRYIGKLQNGKTFDSNTKGKPFSFQLGQGQVIKGWDLGIQGMQVGGERLLIIPPKLGYGKTKNGPIPANSTLTFECKLVDLK